MNYTQIRSLFLSTRDRSNFSGGSRSVDQNKRLCSQATFNTNSFILALSKMISKRQIFLQPCQAGGKANIHECAKSSSPSIFIIFFCNFGKT